MITVNISGLPLLVKLGSMELYNSTENGLHFVMVFKNKLTDLMKINQHGINLAS